MYLFVSNTVILKFFPYTVLESDIGAVSQSDTDAVIKAEISDYKVISLSQDKFSEFIWKVAAVNNSFGTAEDLC